MVILSSVVVIALGAAAMAVIALNHTSKPGPPTAASGTVLSQLTSLPTSITEPIGVGATLGTGAPEAIQGGTPLDANGRPTLLYIGAEFCPYCAAERWALIE